MIKNEIATRYSLALYQLGKENGELVPLRNELNEIWKIINENQDLKNALFHQRILPSEKKEVLDQVFAEETNSHILNFLKLLVDKRREYFLEYIIEEFNKLVNKDENILKVEVTSAVPLKERLLKKLKQKLDQILDYEIILEKKEDPAITGGLVLKIGNYIIDGSISAKLEEMRNKIDKIPISKLGV